MYAPLNSLVCEVQRWYVVHKMAEDFEKAVEGMLECTEEDEEMEAADEDVEELDSDDQSDSSEDGELSLELIGQLNKKIEDNPFMYDNHTELIKILKNAGDLENLRAARENMAKYFPLTPALWLDWIRDEIKLISENSDREAINNLFDRAVKDYQSVDLWLEYVQFAIGGMGGDDGMEKTRSAFEKAITAVGLHASEGCKIWEAYRELESVVFGSLMPSLGAVVTTEQQEAFDAQKIHLDAIFKRQLAIPHLNMTDTYIEYKDWLNDDVDATTQDNYEKALTVLEKLNPLEDALLVAEAPKWNEYQQYIEYELKVGDPSRIQCIFERAITDNCLTPELWLQYTKYLDKLNIKHVVLPVYERSVRNCPWSSALWQRYILALERHKESPELIKETVEKALSSGLAQASDFSTIWTVYCDYLKRQINWEEEHEKELSLFRETVEKALENLFEYFGNSGDENCALKQFWALIEAKMCKNIVKARELWNNIMTEGYGNQANSWLEYYKIERAYGDNKHCRKLLQKALNSVTDWPESITQAYINFEREEGTLEDYDVAVNRCEAQLGRINERNLKAAEKEEMFGQQKKGNKGEKKTNKKFEKNAKQKIKHEHSLPKKNNKAPIQASPNKRKFEEEGEKSGGAEKNSSNNDGFRIPPPPGYTGEPPSKKVKNETTAVEIPKHDASKDSRTVFVSNLLFNVDEDQLREVFCKCGEISQIRLVKNFKGKSKGYAYVEFVDELPVPAALALDRQLVNTRPMYVSKCEDRGGGGKAKAEFKYSTSVEKNKLFVKNLPFTCTKEALAQIFNEHGKLKDVRMITYRSGAPKGLAYIEYHSEEDASHAVLKTDGLKIGEHEISVAISNPPERKAPLAKRDEFVPSLGGGKKDTDVRGKARTQIALLPRSVQKTPASSKPPPGNPSSSSLSSSTSKNGAAGDGSSSAGMSNTDFRNMLLRK